MTTGTRSSSGFGHGGNEANDTMLGLDDDEVDRHGRHGRPKQYRMRKTQKESQATHLEASQPVLLGCLDELREALQRKQRSKTERWVRRET